MLLTSRLGHMLEVGKAGLKILADHAIHVHEEAHYFMHEKTGAMHGPGHIRGVALRAQGELGRVVGLERPEKVQINRIAKRGSGTVFQETVHGGFFLFSPNNGS